MQTFVHPQGILELCGSVMAVAMTNGATKTRAAEMRRSVETHAGQRPAAMLNGAVPIAPPSSH